MNKWILDQIIAHNTLKAFADACGVSERIIAAIRDGKKPTATITTRIAVNLDRPIDEVEKGLGVSYPNGGLRVLVERSGLSQAQLGERMGLGQRSISPILSGSRRMPAPRVGDWAEALGVSGAEILEGLTAESMPKPRKAKPAPVDQTELIAVIQSAIDNGQTVETVANEIGISPSTVALWLTGGRRMSTQSAGKVQAWKEAQDVSLS
jgi:transcriptional regulator with XRE-family HTH domain